MRREPDEEGVVSYSDLVKDVRSRLDLLTGISHLLYWNRFKGEKRRTLLQAYELNTASVVDQIYEFSLIKSMLENNCVFAKSYAKSSDSTRAGGFLTMKHKLVDLNAVALIITNLERFRRLLKFCSVDENGNYLRVFSPPKRRLDEGRKNGEKDEEKNNEDRNEVERFERRIALDRKITKVFMYVNSSRMLKILGYKPKIDVLKGRKGAGGKGGSVTIARAAVGDRETHTMVSEIEIGAEEREDVENALLELGKVFPALNKEVDRVKSMIELAEEGVEGLNKVETKEKLKLTEVS